MSPSRRTSRLSSGGISWRAASLVLFEDRVLQRIDQREQRGFDDVARTPHGGPPLCPYARLDEHTGRGGGPGVAVEDAHLVIVEAHLVERRKRGTERFAQGRVEGVHGAVAGRGRVVQVAADVDLDRRLRV